MTKALLLLPVARLPLQRSDLFGQYRSAIEQVLDALKSGIKVTKRLDIALLFNGGTEIPRSHLFAALQTLFADVYTLVCTVASRLKIDLDFAGGIDVHCVAIDALVPSAPSPGSQEHWYDGPISDLKALLNSRFPYDQHHSLIDPEQLTSKVPTKFRKQFTESTWELLRNDFATSSGDAGTKTLFTIDSSKGSTHKRVAVGGTFDHLHIGHKLLLTATVLIAQPGSIEREITIGITGDELLVNKKHAGVLESWDVRQQRCAEFIESILVFDPEVDLHREVISVDEPGPNGKVVMVIYSPPSTGKITVRYTQISDPFGPTITDESITALVISAETRAGGKAVNDKRTEKGWHALEVFEVDVLDSGVAGSEEGQEPSSTKSTFESKISSTEIRRRLAAAEATHKTGSS